jgi:hypothetical protein
MRALPHPPTYRSHFSIATLAGLSILGLFPLAHSPLAAPAENPLDHTRHSGLSHAGYSHIEILSPDHAQTYSDARTKRYVLTWDEQDHSLKALITFNNTLDRDHLEPRDEETFSFRFPGVFYDASAGVFFVHTRDGQRAVVAHRTNGPFADNVRPTMGTLISVQKPDGQVSVTLSVDPSAPAILDHRSHWIIDGPITIL